MDKFAGSLTDGRAKYLEWCEKVKDRCELYNHSLAKALTEVAGRSEAMTAEESRKLGVDEQVNAELQGFLKEHKMPYTGKQNMIESLHGPMNEENLNGSIPTLLAGCPGLNFNNDIQIPYRFPILEPLHGLHSCKEKCWN